MDCVRKMPCAHLQCMLCYLVETCLSLHWVMPPATAARRKYQDRGSLSCSTHPLSISVNTPTNSETTVAVHVELKLVHSTIHVFRRQQTCKMVHPYTSLVLSMPRCAPMHSQAGVFTTRIPSKPCPLQECSLPPFNMPPSNIIFWS